MPGFRASMWSDEQRGHPLSSTTKGDTHLSNVTRPKMSAAAGATGQRNRWTSRWIDSAGYSAIPVRIVVRDVAFAAPTVTAECPDWAQCASGASGLRRSASHTHVVHSSSRDSTAASGVQQEWVSPFVLFSFVLFRRHLAILGCDETARGFTWVLRSRANGKWSINRRVWPMSEVQWSGPAIRRRACMMRIRWN